MSEFLFGDGFAVSGGDGWRVRRKAVSPSLHRAYLETMISRVFAPSATHLNSKLQVRWGWTQQLSDDACTLTSLGRCCIALSNNACHSGTVSYRIAISARP